MQVSIIIYPNVRQAFVMYLLEKHQIKGPGNDFWNF